MTLTQRDNMEHCKELHIILYCEQRQSFLSGGLDIIGCYRPYNYQYVDYRNFFLEVEV